MSFKTVALKNLIVDREGLDEAHVVKLKESIEAGLLLNPITVNKAGKVIAGRHRYWAEHDLGHKATTVHVVDLDERGEQLATLDENLVRRENNELRLSDMLLARKIVYEKVHADAPKRGGDRSKARPARSAATEHLAKQLGLSQRSVQERIAVAERLDPKAKETIANTESADSIKDLTTLAKLEPADQRAVAKRVAKTGETIKQAARSLDRIEQVKQARAYVTPEGEYGVIVTDYPWRYDDELDGSDAARGGTPYPTMSIAEICDYEIPAAADCALFMWVTNAHLIDPNAYAVVADSLGERYGFTPKGIATWEKDKLGLGHYFRNKTEHLVLLVRGKPVFTDEKPWSHFRAPIGEHSEKPAAAYMAIEKFCASTSRLEMFARDEVRPGWVTTGSELPHEPAPVVELKPKKDRKIHLANDCTAPNCPLCRGAA